MKQKKHLAIAISIASTLGLGATTAQAVDFTATATVENTLAVTVVNDFDVGTVFATVTGAAATNGVAGLVIAPDGTVTTSAVTSATVNLINLGTPVPAQGSVDMASDFDLVFPDTSDFLAVEFDDGGASTLLITELVDTIELTHFSGDPTVPSLYMMHFTVGDVSGGTSAEGTANVGDFTITAGFAATTYVFNIGATITTEPSASLQTYQPGVYSGTFAVTATY